MDIKDLAEELRTRGVQHDLCTAWQKMLLNARDKETLVKMYLRGIDFCIGNDYPSVEYMEQHFKGVCEKFGVFVNEPVDIKNCLKVVTVGCCSGVASYDGYSAGQVFVKHDSRLDIVADDHANVTIDCFDNSIVNIKARGFTTVMIFRYTGAIVNVVERSGAARVKIVDKGKKTY